MTKEERLLRQEQRERAKAIEAAAREAGRGPLDLPYLLLVLTLVGVGLIMLFSASFPSAYYEEGNPAYYLIRQGIFAVLGITAMFIVISKKKDKMATLRYGIVPYVAILGVIAALMAKEPHLSGMVLLLGIGAVMMYVGGIRNYWVGLGFALVLLVIYAFATGIITYNSSRIDIWLDPFNEEWMRDKGYQIRQSLLSIGSGGLFGLGLGKSRQKFLFLPEEHNDFIFAIICEELGLVGATIIMVMFALLVIRGYWIALHARDRFGSLLAVGVTTQIALQVFLNIAVVTNLIPNTGRHRTERFASDALTREGENGYEGHLYLRRHGGACQPRARARGLYAGKGRGHADLIRRRGARTGARFDRAHGLSVPYGEHFIVPPLVQACGDQAQPCLAQKSRPRRA